MNIKEDISCKFCKEIYTDPTILLCCFENICKEHIDDILTKQSRANIFACPLCNTETQDQNFPINKPLKNLIEKREIHKLKIDPKYAILIDSLKEKIKHFERIQADPDNLIYEKIHELKARVDLDRETLKNEIDVLANEIIDKLEAFETELKTESKSVANSEYYNDLIRNIKEQLKDYEKYFSSLATKSEDLEEKSSEINEKIQLMEFERNEFENKIFSNKTLAYETKKIDQEKLFGKLFIREKIDSNILETDKLYNELMDLCDFEDQKWKLVYRASRDGFRADDFHCKCDAIYNTLTVVKTTNSTIFGGYTFCPWLGKNKFEEDPFAFIFSLVNKHSKPLLFKCSDHEKAIKPKKDFGACFGDGDLVIASDSNLNEESSFVIGKSFSGCNQISSESINEKKFQTVEIEVFQKENKPLSQNEILLIKEKIEQTNETDEERIENFYEFFNAFAVNGMARKKNCLNFLHAMPNKNKEDKLIGSVILGMHFDQVAQRNNKNEISFIEFTETLLISDNEEAKTKLFFDLIDKDKNEKLELDEIKEFFGNLFESKEMNKVFDYLIKELEKKTTGVKYFTKDEFVKISRNYMHQNNKK